jgi:hypothetical protein
MRSGISTNGEKATLQIIVPGEEKKLSPLQASPDFALQNIHHADISQNFTLLPGILLHLLKTLVEVRQPLDKFVTFRCFLRYFGKI